MNPVPSLIVSTTLAFALSNTAIQTAMAQNILPKTSAPNQSLRTLPKDFFKKIPNSTPIPQKPVIKSDPSKACYPSTPAPMS